MTVCDFVTFSLCHLFVRISDFLGDITRCLMSSNVGGEYRLAKIGPKGESKSSQHKMLTFRNTSLKYFANISVSFSQNGL